MKHFILALPLLLGSGCGTLRSIAEVPVAVVGDVEDGVDVLTPDDEAAANQAGQVAGTGVTLLTGNAALGAGAGALVTGIAAWFLRRRKK